VSNGEQRWSVPPGISKARADRLLSGAYSEYSRADFQRAFEQGLVLCRGQPLSKSSKLSEGDVVHFRMPSVEPLGMEPVDLQLAVVFEDEHLIAIDKPAGLVVHPAYGHPSGTLANALLHYFRNLSKVSGTERPGIVHRLDKDTSGLLVIARDDLVHDALAKQFKEKTTERQYLAVVWGRPKPAKDTIASYIVRSEKDRRKMKVSDRRGKWAVTHYELIESFRLLSLLRLRLETGRTHQIRVQLAHRGHPVFGDPVYSGRKSQLQGLGISDTQFATNLLADFNRQALHAHTLAFTHPVTGERLFFKSDMPGDMQQLIRALKAEKSREG